MNLENYRDVSGEVIEGEPDPEELDHTIEHMLLSCERVGEGGKAVVLKLSADDVAPQFTRALNALKIESSHQDKAIKLFKLYLPNKGAWEYNMHQRAYNALQDLPEGKRKDFAMIPALSAERKISWDNDIKEEIEQRFSVSIMGREAQLIAMEYINGEDLGTVFYKWILERERVFSPEEIDRMTFTELYEEVSARLGFGVMPGENIDDPRALELAEWKNSAVNTAKLYDYLRKHNFPFSPDIAQRVGNTLQLLHDAHIMHGDAFERNIMVTGGIHALRSKGSLTDEDIYLIDFGEAKDHFVDGVDEFAVVRRLKQLGQSRADESKIAQDNFSKELNGKAQSLLTRDKAWQRFVGKIDEMAPSEVIGRIWNATAGIDPGWVDRFFIAAKIALQKNVVSAGQVANFIKEKEVKMTPHQRQVTKECSRWLEEA